MEIWIIGMQRKALHLYNLQLPGRALEYPNQSLPGSHLSDSLFIKTLFKCIVNIYGEFTTAQHCMKRHILNTVITKELL